MLKDKPRQSITGLSPVRQAKTAQRPVIEPSAEFEFNAILETLQVKPVGLINESDVSKSLFSVVKEVEAETNPQR